MGAADAQVSNTYKTEMFMKGKTKIYKKVLLGRPEESPGAGLCWFCRDRKGLLRRRQGGVSRPAADVVPSRRSVGNARTRRQLHEFMEARSARRPQTPPPWPRSVFVRKNYKFVQIRPKSQSVWSVNVQRKRAGKPRQQTSELL